MHSLADASLLLRPQYWLARSAAAAMLKSVIARNSVCLMNDIEATAECAVDAGALVRDIEVTAGTDV